MNLSLVRNAFSNLLGAVIPALVALGTVPLVVQGLGDANYGGLPVPQYDQFQYLDRPLVSGRDVQHLRQVWMDYERETQSWANWTPADLVKEGRIRTVP